MFEELDIKIADKKKDTKKTFTCMTKVLACRTQSETACYCC